MPLTYVDASVLIAARGGRSDQARRAFVILDDPAREFAASDFLRLEVLPKAIFHRQADEIAFYKEFFQAVARWAVPDVTLINAAFELATKYGLAAMDALHVAAAQSLGASEYVTGEKPTKPVFRVREINIHSIHM